MHRLLTKEDRLKSQNLQFDSLIKEGYAREDYNDLILWTAEGNNKFKLKVFQGTAAHHIAYYWYKTKEQCDQGAVRFKKNSDAHARYKKERKANKTKSSHAATAEAIRNELKTHYPGIKFSVTSRCFSMGDSVDVDWTDGPTTLEVTKISSKYQFGHFDGMTDMYEHSNTRDDISQVKYVNESRRMSKEIEAILLPQAEIIFNDHSFGCHSSGNLLYQIFCQNSIPAGATVTGIEETGHTAGQLNDFYKIGYTLPETNNAPNNEPVEVKAGTVNIIDYSEKAIAVIGDTKPIKDKLKELGGRFNSHLSCGPGWIFSKKQMEIVKALLTC